MRKVDKKKPHLLNVWSGNKNGLCCFSPFSAAAPHQYFHSHLCCRENEAQMSEVERDLEGLVKFFSLYHSQSKKYEQGWSW